MSEYTVSYSPTRSQLRSFARGELWRTQGGFLLAAPIVIGAVLLASLEQRYWWIAGFVAGSYLTYLAVLYASYRGVESVPVDYSITMTLTESGIRSHSPLGASDVPWSAIRRVRRVRGGLVLEFRSGRRSVAIPSTVLTEEIVQFVEAGVRAR